MDDVEREKIWLVKSSARISGPYSTDELAERLLSREYGVLDEVQTPGSRWSYVRERKELSKVVDQVRTNSVKANDKTVAGAATRTRTSTSTQKLDDDHLEFIDENTPLPIHPQKDKNGDQILRDVQPTRDEVVVPHKKANKKTYSYQNDSRVQEQEEKSRSRTFKILGAIALTALVFAMVGGYFKSWQRNELMAQSEQAAIRLFDLGLHEKALEKFNLSTANKLPSKDAMLRFGPLQALRTGEKKIWLDRLQQFVNDESLDRESKVLLYRGLGLIYLSMQEYRTAEANFETLLAQSPSDRVALANLASLSLRAENHAKAKEQIDKLLEIASGDAFPLSFLALENLNRVGGDSKETLKIIDLIMNRASQSWDLRSENIVLAVGLLQKIGSTNKIKEMIEQFVQMPIREATNFSHSPFIDMSLITFPGLMQICSTAAKAVGDEVQSLQMQIRCLIEARQEPEAEKLLKKLNAMDPKNQMLPILQAQLQYSLGHFPELKVIAGMPEVKNRSISNALYGFVCARDSDWSCARDHYQAAIGLDPNNLMAVAGLAEVYMQTATKKQALSVLIAGIRAEPNYIPFLELNEFLQEGP